MPRLAPLCQPKMPQCVTTPPQHRHNLGIAAAHGLTLEETGGEFKLRDFFD